MTPEELNRVAAGHYRKGDLRAAVNALTTALKLDPDHVDSHLNVASLLLEARQVDLAEMHAERAVALAPRRYDALLGMGLVARVREQSGAALDWLTQAEEVAPDRVEAPMAIGATCQEMGQPAQAIAAFDRALRWHPANADLRSNRLFAMNFLAAFVPAEWLSAHREYERRIRIPRIPRTPRIAALPVMPRDVVLATPLRIGYVSADFRNHAIARFLLPVLRHHDRGHVHVTGYYTGRIVDAVTREIAALCEMFRPMAAVGDDEFLEQLADDAIDVLIDLSGHSSGNRLPVFAARMAPLQVTWLGYLGSTGLTSMDVRLTDGIADPAGVSEAWHSERLVRLPGTLWIYEPYADAPVVGASPGTRNGFVTFGVLSNPSKLSDAALSAWAAILVAVPSSVMMIMARDDDAMRERIRAPFRSAGIDDARIRLLSRLSTRAYLDAYGEIDIALDTFPFSGGTTVCDALWQGVPVLAVKSLRPFGATSASVLHQVGLDDWVCDGPAALVALATGKATDGDAIAQLRSNLRERMHSSALMDAAGFTRTLEGTLLKLARGKDTSAR